MTATKMKLTRETIRQINAECRRVCGGRRSVEVGDRNGLNFLLWDDETDLQETIRTGDLIGAEVETFHGWVALDCYCYNLPLFGREPDDALDTNAYILIAPTGNVRYGSQDHRGHMLDIRRILRDEAGVAFPATRFE
jgi:hypothetical protein